MSTRQQEFERLERVLHSGAESGRVQATYDLGAYPEWAVEPLCRALQDRALSVRVAASQTLGDVGDARAVLPLLRAWRASFWLGSSRRQGIAAGLLVAVLFLCFGLGLTMESGSVALLAVICLYAMGFAFQSQRKQSWICASVSEALADIAERTPCPELAQVVPELRWAVADRFIQADVAREAARRSATRIQAVTAGAGALPLAAAPPGQRGSPLPRPVCAPDPLAELLPRVSASVEAPRP